MHTKMIGKFTEVLAVLDPVLSQEKFIYFIDKIGINSSGVIELNVGKEEITEDITIDLMFEVKQAIPVDYYLSRTIYEKHIILGIDLLTIRGNTNAQK